MFTALNMQAGVYATHCFGELDSARICRASALGTQEANQGRQQRTRDSADLAMDTEQFHLSGAHGQMKKACMFSE